MLLIGNTRLSGAQLLEGTDTTIKFVFPALGGGKYLMRVENPQRGYANNVWMAEIIVNAWGLDVT